MENVKADIDYKTLKISTNHTVRNVIENVISKFRFSCRDINLFEILMELRTMIDGQEVIFSIKFLANENNSAVVKGNKENIKDRANSLK